MAWTQTSSTVIDLPNGAKVYEGYFDAICDNFDNVMGATSTGFPSGVTALGSYTTAPSEYLQHGSGNTTMSGAGVTIYPDAGPVTVTFPVAFTSVPLVIASASSTSDSASVAAGARAVTTTTFRVVGFADTSGLVYRVAYVALGN